MARYIDADELYSRVKRKTNPYGKPTLDYESGVKVLDMIKNTPTADVVPKSEVERLQAEKDALIKNYAECMKDYARDIFEGIEKHLIFNTYGIATISNKTFAELKKKYIGGNDDRE